jgi:hypothetical protein
LCSRTWREGPGQEAPWRFLWGSCHHPESPRTGWVWALSRAETHTCSRA